MIGLLEISREEIEGFVTFFILPLRVFAMYEKTIITSDLRALREFLQE